MIWFNRNSKCLLTLPFSNLRLCTYNCKNIKSSIEEILLLASSSDIILLQETWLADFDLSMLSSIHKDFYGQGISSMKSDTQVLVGRPYGGLAVLWRKSLGNRCRVVDLDDDRLMGMEITDENGCKLLILNVYLPYSASDNKDEFLFYLSKLENIMSNFETPYSIACGDFNSHTNMTGTSSHLFGKYFESFCRAENLVVTDCVILPNNSYTFMDAANNTAHWLDHLVATNSAHLLIDRVDIRYDCISSDHHPVIANIALGNIKLEDPDSMKPTNNRGIRWDKLSAEEILQYKLRSEEELAKVELDHSLILCDDPHCVDTAHLGAIERMYKGTCEALPEASIQFKSKPKLGYTQVQGWTRYCKEIHGLARDAYLVWRDHGRRRQGILYESMKKMRAQFKRALRQCKRDTSVASANSLANKLLQKDDRAFWKEVKKVNNTNTPLASTVHGATGGEAITSMWKEHFQNLLNSSSDISGKDFVDKSLSQKESYCFTRFTPNDIIDAISSLKKGKSPGNDGIYGEHFIFAHDKVAFLLSMIFNSCIIHGHIPQSMMDTVLIPIIKDKKGSVTDRDNYRPVAITCIISKVLELVLLDRYSDNLRTTHNQFGFKAKLGTDLCIFTLKQVIEYYRSLSSPVYAAFMDASKAFDKVNHYHLLGKLLKRDIPTIIVRLLYFWYKHQLFMVRWGNMMSDSFNVSNGVRQGGILSPVCFNIYLDELSTLLNNCNTGCTINSCVANHLFYADDSILLGSSPKALQTLINMCEIYANKYELSFNVKKTKIMCFKPKSLSKMYIPDFFLNGNKLPIVSSQMYLGVCVEDSFTDNGDLARQTKAVYARGNVLIKKFSLCDTEVKTRLFKAYCSSFYCSQLWSTFTTTSFRKLQSSYNRVLRVLFKLDYDSSISAKCLELNIDCMKVLLRKSVYGFRCRILTCDNFLIQNIVKTTFFLYSSLSKRWNSLLFHLKS